jgi:hypothetical protein
LRHRPLTQGSSKGNASAKGAVTTRIENGTIIDGILAVDSIKAKRTVVRVIVGQQSQCVVEIRAIGAIEARLVGASDDARFSQSTPTKSSVQLQKYRPIKLSHVALF